jgi:hypothetical protein
MYYPETAIITRPLNSEQEFGNFGEVIESLASRFRDVGFELHSVRFTDYPHKGFSCFPATLQSSLVSFSEIAYE